MSNGIVQNLRVRFCLEMNELLCGPYEEALVVDVRPNAATSASLKQPWVIGVIVVIVLLALMALLIILRCCCCRKAKSLKNDELNSNHGLGLQRPSIIHGTQPPPYSTSVSGSGIDNKGVDTSLKDSDDNLKAHLYGNGSTSVHHVGGHHGGYGGVHHVHDPPHSNSNSANGGSVNSQDSLWNVKANSGTATDIYHLQQQLQPQHSQSAGVASTASGQVPATTTLVTQGGQPQQALPNGYSMYDPSHHQQQQPQQYQTQQPQQHQTASHFRGGFVGNEDYTHYPYPDEYLNERNRQYVHAQAQAAAAGGDPYAAVNKPKHAECKFFLCFSSFLKQLYNLFCLIFEFI